MKNYLVNRQQHVRVNSGSSTWEEVISWVSQGSILGHLFLNIFLTDLFLFAKNSDLSNYADGNILYSSGNVTKFTAGLGNSNKMVLRKLYGFELG